jgi:hypothetical protein
MPDGRYVLVNGQDWPVFHANQLSIQVFSS